MQSLKTEDAKKISVGRETRHAYQRINFEKHFKKSLQDPLYGNKRAARFYNRQAAYAVLQLLVTVFAIILIAVNV